MSKCCPLTLTQARSRYHLFDNGLFKMSPDLHHLLLQLSRVTYWLLVQEKEEESMYITCEKFENGVRAETLITEITFELVINVI